MERERENGGIDLLCLRAASSRSFSQPQNLKKIEKTRKARTSATTTQRLSPRPLPRPPRATSRPACRRRLTGRRCWPRTRYEEEEEERRRGESRKRERERAGWAKKSRNPNSSSSFLSPHKNTKTNPKTKQEAIVKSEVNAKQLSAAEASDRAHRGLPVPPGGVVPEPGAAVGDDIAALREHTIKILAEEAFVDRVVFVPPSWEQQGGGEKGGEREEAKGK